MRKSEFQKKNHFFVEMLSVINKTANSVHVVISAHSNQLLSAHNDMLTCDSTSNWYNTFKLDPWQSAKYTVKPKTFFVSCAVQSKTGGIWYFYERDKYIHADSTFIIEPKLIPIAYLKQ